MPISSAHSGEKGNSAATGVALFVAGEIVSVTVAVDELDSVGYCEFLGAMFCLLSEQLAHVDTHAGDSVVACPGAQHLA